MYVSTYVLPVNDKTKATIYHHPPQAHGLVPHAGGLLTKYYYITPHNTSD